MRDGGNTTELKELLMFILYLILQLVLIQNCTLPENFLEFLTRVYNTDQIGRSDCPPGY